MFNFLRKKLKDTISGMSKKIDEEGEEAEEQPEEEIKQEIKEIPKEEIQEEEKEEPKEKKSFFEKIKERFIPKKELPEEEGFEEVSVKAEFEEKKQEQEKKEAEKKVEKKETPSIQDLTEMSETKMVSEHAQEPQVLDRKGIEEIKEKAEEVKKDIEEEKEAPKEEEIEKIKEEVKEIKEEVEKEEKKGFFGRLKERIVTKKINEKQFEDLFWNLEIALLENNVAVQVIEKIKQDLKNGLVDKPIRRNKIESTISLNLKKSIEELFDVEKIDLMDKIKQKKPYVLCFVGINGSGKTTTIAKIAQLLKNNNLSCVLAASDTFRAASIEQLQKHADNLQVKLIKHDYGSDPAAVAFDAIKYAESKAIDVVLIDTAGRMHSNINLMDELKKIIRVTEPDMKIFVGESITGNDCVEQAQKFNEAIEIDAIVLAKADIDEKGGAAISVSYVTKKPIIFIGTGQEYSDLKEFDSDLIVNSLGLEG